jgi:hypothetical protein
MTSPTLLTTDQWSLICGWHLNQDSSVYKTQWMLDILEQSRQDCAAFALRASHVQTRGDDMKKEADVKAEVKRVLATYGDRIWWFMPVPTGFGVQGVPDFVCSFAGRFVGIETKFGSNGLTKFQIKQIEAITKTGGATMVINETNVGNLPSVVDGILALEDKK